ncbi:uncharacterized protein DUF4837 [Gelidibacter algens]|uniref:Uncharacterized protein DUF4837 n=1 Tax=Gelidibacter algens TaxID=49280 RepID=A0A1A7QZL8_9FLAO|nr:DUF4837 family protein [Gelidibacter algens]OBX23972.1 DUF4837 domain-containing protein [Gelidibacter algens]RAJ24351.1 uncharacterized protein DUF4837 [Gelidibacter algens]
MKTFYATVFALILFTSCNNGKDQRIIPGSNGNINDLLVVVDNLLWEDSVGETIRDVVAAPVPALNQEEPLFSLSQMPPMVFDGFATKSRTILKIEKGGPAGMVIKNDVYARPQTVVVVSGKTDQEIKEQLESNGDKIIAAFKKEELKENQRRIKISLMDDAALEKALGVKLKFQTAYRIAKQDKDFFWIRKEIPTGTMDIMIYEVPLSTIEKGDSTIVDIVRMRDSIGKVHIPGPVEGSYMITEEAYTPFLFETKLDGKPTYETKGLWDVKNAFMSGPFVNYAIKDTANNRYVVIEGYVFSPSVEKRDNIFELEAIIKSIQIQ